MTGLKCTTCNCEHNCGCHCDASIVNIDKKGCCCTKQKRELGILEQNKVNMEAARDFDYNDNEDVFIQCDCCDCAHNRNNACTSEMVDVGDGLIKTKCFTKRVNN